MRGRRWRQNFACFFDGALRDETIWASNQHPRRGVSAIEVAARAEIHKHGLFLQRRRGGSDYRLEIHELIRYVHGKDAVGSKLAEIKLERLQREQVNRDGIAGKGVHGEHVELLRRLLLKREPRIAYRDIYARGRILQKCEFRLRELHDQRIDFVKRVTVARAAI